MVYATNTVVYDLVVDEFHNFCVGRDGIVVHNFAITIPIFVFGLGEVVVASGILEVIGASCFSALTYSIIKGLTGAKEGGEGYIPELLDADSFDLFGKPEVAGLISFDDSKTPDPNGAQAPGKPTEVEGFYPPKNWDGKRQPNPDTGEYGWKDKKGSYWVPTGHKPTAHAGPHWDVQDRNGGHRNIYPGGKER